MKTKIIFILMIAFMTIKGYSQTRVVKVNDTLRQFTVYQSTKINNDEKVPLLLNFHGSGMTAIEHMLYTQTNTLAEDKGFIVAYPQGINNDWNVGFEQDYDHGTKDVEFINVLIKKLIKNYPIDSTKIYATGLSRGGFFIQRLVAELPHTISGFVSVSAPMPTEVKKRMQSQEMVKAMYVHGTKDDIVSRDGKEDSYLSVEQCISYWKIRNKVHIEPKMETIDKSEDDTSVKIVDHNTVIEIQIENGGHTWPGADAFNVGFPLGKTTQDIELNSILYNFLLN